MNMKTGSLGEPSVPKPAPPLGLLSPFERAAVRLARFSNEHATTKRALHWFMTRSVPWIKLTIGPRFYVEGIERVHTMQPDRGIVFVANHRSFFDMYIVMLAMFWRGPGWTRRMFFPVRSNFFYEQPIGVLLNYAMGGGSMYPPIFRDPAKAAFNQEALDTVARQLALPGTLVGMHPEGTRGKGPDPYDLLPAQPGVGQMILQSRPIVIPLFINGLSNDFLGDCIDTYRPNIKRTKPIIIVFGEPVDFSDFYPQKPRAALYKKAADRTRDAILACAARERVLRAQIADGTIPDSAPAWLYNMPRKAA
jgi:1-acyl-sn-glycerol-3-phosphate acyltransferase